MYNLNVPSSGEDGLALALPQSGSQTPRTPEVLNTLMAVINPLDSYSLTNNPKLASSPPGDSDMGSGSTGTIVSAGAAVSPTNPAVPLVSSIQRTKSLLIKEGLKLSIQAKRGSCSSLSSISSEANPGVEQASEKPAMPLPFHRDDFTMDSIGSDDGDDGMSSIGGDGVMLTVEDEERRRRRREKNKIAATKCRLKKRARTVKLEEESKILENQNIDLKAEIEKLKTEKDNLVEMLSGHQKHCKKNHRVGLYSDDDFGSPSSSSGPEFISTDLASNSFQTSGSEPLANSLTAHSSSSLDYRKLSSGRRINQKSESLGTGHGTTPSQNYQMDRYPLDPNFSPSEPNPPVRQPNNTYCYPSSEPVPLNYHHYNRSNIKPPLGISNVCHPAGTPDYYDRSGGGGYPEVQSSSGGSYDMPTQPYHLHQSPFAHSDFNDNTVELISPSSTATSSFTDYSTTSDATNFSHFPIPCTTSPVDDFSQSNPRYNNCCVFEINN